MKLNKDSSDKVLIETEHIVVDKELAFSKQDYAALVKRAFDLLQSDEAKDKRTLISLNGLYYTSFAGLLRSGVLCSRNAGEDGMPVITVNLGNRNYSVREYVLKSILGAEAEYIIKPWEDTCDNESIFSGCSKDDAISSGHSSSSDAAIKVENEQLKKVNAEQQSSIDKLTKDIEKLKLDNYNMNVKKTLDASDDSGDSSYKAEIAKLNKAHQKEIEDLKISAGKRINALKKQLTEEEKEHRKYKEQASAELADSKKYVYDPNYDHYYSDVLPKLVDSIEFANTDIIIRELCLGISVVSILFSLAFVL